MSLTDQQHETYWQEYFAETVDEYENGNRDAADVWAQFRSEIEMFERECEARKAWGNENREAVISEFEKYGKDGFRGYTATTHTTVKYSYDHIQEWNAHKKALTDIETDAKNAIKVFGSGGHGADMETGQVTIAAKKQESYSLKTTKIKVK